jgi:hypothetical protein
MERRRAGLSRRAGEEFMPTRRILLLIPALVLALAAWTFADTTLPASEPLLLGFSNDHANRQRELETRFDSHLEAASLREWMKRLSARPHHVGSPYGKENAEFMAGLFRSWGFQTEIEQFKVLFPTPKTRVLEMVAPTRFKASLSEPPLKEDSTSGQTAEQLPTYNAYSIDGDVTGDLVYVNYGVPRDYDELDRRGIDVKGKIVIARYGGSWRGIKPSTAPSAASSSPTPPATATPRGTPIPRGAGAPTAASSAARWPTCPPTRGIRSPRAWGRPRTPGGWTSRTPRR